MSDLRVTFSFILRVMTATARPLGPVRAEGNTSGVCFQALSGVARSLVGATNYQALYITHILLIAISCLFSILFNNRGQRLTVKLVRKAISPSFLGLAVFAP